MATTTISGAGGTTTSFSNTPQAQGDVFNYTEDNVVIVNAAQSIILLDVMANDLGGNAKTLFSVDDGISASTATKQYAPIDLTTQDVQATGISNWESIGGGVSIRINNGKVEMDLSQYLLSHGFTSLQALGAGDNINETFTYAIKLGNGTLSWASVSVNIQGKNDGATITAAAAVDNTVVEAGGVANGTPGDPSAHGQLIISDVDLNENHFQTPPSLQGTYGTFTFDATSGAWTYALNQTLADPLTQGQQVTDMLQVKSADGTATYNIVVNITGTNDAAVVSHDVRNLTEGNAAADISTSGTLTISDVDSDPHFVAQAGTAGLYGTFAIDADGAWTYTASSAHDEFVAGTTYTDTFNVVSADGTPTTVTINILGTNDAAVLSSDVKNLTETNAAADISTSGTLTISDVDSDAHFVAQAGTAGLYGTFAIDADGAWTYTASSAHDEFVAGTTYTDTFNVVSADGTPTTVTINILGTNDAAVLSSDVKNLTETNAAADISTSGTLTISDVDSDPHFVAQAGTAGLYGTFAIDADGAWTCTASSAHDEFVAGTTYTDTFNVVSADGTPTTVTINILGTNDAAVLSSDVKNLTETNAAADISTSGTLTISDVDSDPHFVAQAGTAGLYGTFAIDADGAWTYTASSAHDEFVAGTTYTDTFNVVSADGTPTTVTINILGTNDAAVLSSDVKNLTETNAAADISTSGTLTISDVDSDPHFVAQAGTAGLYGTFAIDADGAWTYTASSAHDEFVAGTTYTDTFNVVSADGTPTTVTINILGTNDAAVLSSDVKNLTETNAAADISTSGTLTISDVDSDPHFVAQAGTAGLYGTFAIDADGAWTYTASSAHDEFVAGTTYTDTFNVVSADGTPTTVTINILGTNDAAVLSSDVKNLTETNAAADISTSGTLTISDVDSDPHFVAQAGTAGLYGTFAIDADGAWTYTASSAHDEFVAGTTYTDTFNVVSADGTPTTVTINILGTNDAAVLSSDVKNLTETNAAADISTSGTLTISDVDSDAHFVAQAGTAGLYGTFAIDADGAWTYTASSAHDEFVAGTTYTDTFNVVSADGTPTTVTINILGTNDAAVLSSDVKNLTETNAAADISTSGTLTISDVDSDAHFVAQAGTAGLYGTFAIDADGAWTYTASSAHDEFVAGTTYTDTFNVVSADGTPTTVTINILGTNDAAVLSSDVKNLTETNAAADISTSGTLTISDVDSDPHFVAQAGTAGLYGTFAIDADGAWTYTASSAHDEFVAGTTYTDTFNVVSADGTPTTVTINILGTNDAAVLSSDVKNLTETNAAADISTSGTLTISDVDSDPHFVAQAGTAGLYGTFAIDADGAWTYTASSAHDEFVAGTTYTDTFNVVSADGTPTTVTINILGTNDAAVLSSDVKNLTETNAAADISTSGTLTISDVDSDPHFVAQAGTAGLYGTFAIDADGAWTYTASSAHDEFVAGTTYTDTFNVVSADGTPTTVTINILGTNDAAVITLNGAQDTSVTEKSGVANGTPGDATASGDLNATDVDNAATFTAQVAVAKSYGTFSIDANGTWSYTLDDNNATVQALNSSGANTTLYELVTVTTVDGTQQVIDITINGANDAAVITVNGVQDTSVTEKSGVANGTPGDATASGDLNASDVDNAATFNTQVAVAKSYGTFSIDANGTWSYTLDDNNATVQALNSTGANTTLHELVTVTTVDGTQQVIDITINGANDAAVLSSASVNLTEGNAAADISTSGTLTISDVDSSATFVVQAATAGLYGTFAINAAGAWTYTASSAHDEFIAGQHYTENFDVVSADGTHTSIAIDILGTDDGPPRFAPTDIQLTPSTTTADVSFSSFQFTGTLSATDPDPGGSFVYSITSQSDPGLFSISGNTLSSSLSGLSPSKAYSITVQATQVGDPAGPTYQYSETFQVITGSNGNSSDGLNGANGGDDVLYGNGGADIILGMAGNDTLFGQDGNDTLNGGDGNDRLVGGVGADTLTGGLGADTFYYGSAISDSPVSVANDTITDFVHGVDKIDLSSIDANTVSGGDQAFLFGGFNAATVANSITWSEVGGNTIVRVDVNGNATADFQITLTGTGLGLTASDFVL